MSSMRSRPSLLVDHADEDVFVLVDHLHDVRVTLPEGDEERLQQSGVVKDLVAEELELLYVSQERQRVGDS